MDHPHKVIPRKPSTTSDNAWIHVSVSTRIPVRGSSEAGSEVTVSADPRHVCPQVTCHRSADVDSVQQAVMRHDVRCLGELIHVRKPLVATLVSGTGQTDMESSVVPAGGNRPGAEDVIVLPYDAPSPIDPQVIRPASTHRVGDLPVVLSKPVRGPGGPGRIVHCRFVGVQTHPQPSFITNARVAASQ